MKYLLEAIRRLFRLLPNESTPQVTPALQHKSAKEALDDDYRKAANHFAEAFSEELQSVLKEKKHGKR